MTSRRQAGVRDSQIAKIGEQRQLHEPAHHGTYRRRVMSERLQRSGMLIPVLVRVLPQVFTRRFRVRRVIADRVVFMVAHHRTCGTRVNHRPHDFQHLTNLRAAVDEVAKKSGALGMMIDILIPAIAESFEQRIQLTPMTVDTANRIESEGRAPKVSFLILLSAAYSPSSTT